MTTQIDDQFTNFLACSFTAETLSAMSPEQRQCMRDLFFAGFMTSLAGHVFAPLEELATYKREIGTSASQTKARHCVQEALIIKRMEN